MKAIKFLTLISIVGLFTLSSCDKGSSTADDLTPATIRVKSGGAEKSIDFVDYYIIKNTYGNDDELNGLSWLTAHSGGKMVDEISMLSLYFDQINSIEVGSVITPKHFSFSFPSSSDSNNYVDSYKGKITLLEKDRNSAVVHFENVTVHVAFGDYVINGNLKCSLLEKYPWDN